MNIIVFLKMVPDVIEELKIADNGVSLDEDWVRLILSEPDSNALEQAIILKEKNGGRVTVIAPESPEVDDALFLALAKGADKAIKLIGDWKDLRSPSIAQLLLNFLNESNLIEGQTLLLSGSQANDDLEGELVFYLAELLKLPCHSVITGVTYNSKNNLISVIKEFAGGLRGEFELPLPAVLGIQTSENPLRYIPIAKIRSIMKTARIEEVEIQSDNLPNPLAVNKLLEPEVSGSAEMLEGSLSDIASRVVDILSERGLIQRRKL